MFRATLPVTLAAALFAFGCGGTTASTDTDTKADAMPAMADDSSVVARSGETTVTKNEFDAEMLAIPKRARERYNTDRGRKSIIERMLLNKVMLAEAKARGITADPLVQLAAQAAANKAYVAAFTNSLQDNSTDDAAVQAYYEENQQRYAREMVKAKHILVKEAATAAEVNARNGTRNAWRCGEQGLGKEAGRVAHGVATANAEAGEAGHPAGYGNPVAQQRPLSQNAGL